MTAKIKALLFTALVYTVMVGSAFALGHGLFGR
jgi:hypothetical protein